ncbi:hypothetical protein AUK22_06305 [bacterium CG2_30_54_10]|nr:MAG: hypothetical protein AUK22_06305 [bacterium CG2_30_54_10]
MTESQEKLKVNYSREGDSVYLSHLDAVDILSRAIRRARLPYRISQGCHIRPKVAFGPPLPLGHSSKCEFMILYLESAVDPEEVKKRLSTQVPSGFVVLSVVPLSKDEPSGNKIRYRLGFRPGATVAFDFSKAFLSDPGKEIIMRRGAGQERLPLGQAVLSIEEITLGSNLMLQVNFQQGIKGIPSAGRIITALAEEMGPAREDLLIIERNAFLP